MHSTVEYKPAVLSLAKLISYLCIVKGILDAYSAHVDGHHFRRLRHPLKLFEPKPNSL